jgi:hypothetical protein
LERWADGRSLAGSEIVVSIGAIGISSASYHPFGIFSPDYQYVFRMSPIRLIWAGEERWSFCRA